MSTDNKLSLLASLTSLPDDGLNKEDEDSMLPPLAIDEDDVVSNQKNNTSNPVTTSGGLFGVEPNTDGLNADAARGLLSSAEPSANVSTALLNSSGLLNTITTTVTGATGGSSGGGLFDQLEEEEEMAQEKARKEKEQMLLLEKQKQEAEAAKAAEASRLEKEKQQEMERAAIAATAQAAAKAAVEESVMSSTNLNHVEGSVMGGMQELSLNGESTMSLGYRSEPNAYSNLRQDNMNNPMQQQQQIYQSQNQPAQYPPQQPPPIPQEQPPPVPPQQQPMMQLQQQQQHPQQIQQAGYGASSYYYSTTGNVQQVHQQQPTNPMTNQNSSGAVYSAQNQGANAMASSSYAERSNIMQNSHYQPSQTVGQVVAPQYQQQQMQHHHQQQLPPTQHHLPNQQQFPSNLAHQQQQQQQYVGQGVVNQHQPQPHLSNANNTQHILSKPKIKPPPYNPNDFKPAYGPITVTDPILVQSPGVFSGPPHWIYNVIVRDVKKVEGQDQFSPIVSNVRRRFRHFVALEDRIRTDCLGAILPPRPDKHPTRAIDEASARQSTQFALQRAKELETYLNGLRLHPLAGKSPSLQLFLTHPDHIGAAWPEVSSSIFTRLTEVGTSTAVKITEGTSAVMSELNNESQILAGEDNSELMALASSEGLRIGSVLQSVPRIEGAVAIVGELGERMSVSGLEIQKLVTNVLAHEREFCGPFECLASGLLRSGRRTTRLAIELGAAAQAFTLQYKICRYERMAFADRRSALVRRRDARVAADKKAQKLVVHQHSMQSMGHGGMMDGVAREAQMSDEIATDAFNEAEQVGQILKCEVGRIADMRKKDWGVNLKIIAANMREAHAERVAIWESCRNSLLAAEQNPYEASATAESGGGATAPVNNVVQESVQFHAQPQVSQNQM